MITLAADPWLAETMKRPVHRVTLSRDGSGRIEAPRGFYYGKLPTAEIASVAGLGDIGFRLVDTSVTLERAVAMPAVPDARVRAATPEDRESVMAIARSSFRWSRFHLDPLIPSELADEIKAQWAGNFFTGLRGDHMLVAEAGGTVAGFLQLLRAPDGAVVIDLIAVKEAERGRGLGGAMIRNAERLLPGGRMRVGTQVANAASLRFYESLGFRTVASTYVMHLHA
jgi:ribosomal protein S18 acetylase RimI-like enzyme